MIRPDPCEPYRDRQSALMWDQWLAQLNTARAVRFFPRASSFGEARSPFARGLAHRMDRDRERQGLFRRIWWEVWRIARKRVLKIETRSSREKSCKQENYKYGNEF